MILNELGSTRLHSANCSMKRFMELVDAGNWHFTLAKSTLKPIIDRLGGPYVKTQGADMRVLNRAALVEMQELIWPQGDGVANSPWGRKKVKYARALGYLAEQLFGLQAGDALLVGSYKTNWTLRRLQASKRFVSASSAKEAELATSGGLSKRFASELCIPANGLIGDWPEGHKFVFGTPMRETAEGALESPGAVKGQGFGQYTYCFSQPQQTRYMCMFDVENTPRYKGEVAFVDDVTTSFIKVYDGGTPKQNQLWVPAQWV